MDAIEAQVRDAFEKFNTSKIPEVVRGGFDQEISNLIDETVAKANLAIKSSLSLDVPSFVSSQIQAWVRGKMDQFVYMRYLKFMKTTGKTPNNFAWFRKRKGDNTPPQLLFLTIEKNKIIIGAKVMIRDRAGMSREGIVIGFNRDCRLHIKLDDDTEVFRFPTNVKLPGQEKYLHW